MNNEKALEALKAECDWLNADYSDNNPRHERLVKFLRNVRASLTSPFDEAIKIVEDKIAFINAETFEDYDRIKHYREVLSALKARLPK